MKISPVKCSVCTLKTSKKSLSAIRHIEHLQLQLDKFSEHETEFIFLSLVRNSLV